MVQVVCELGETFLLSSFIIFHQINLRSPKPLVSPRSHRLVVRIRNRISRPVKWDTLHSLILYYFHRKSFNYLFGHGFFPLSLWQNIPTIHSSNNFWMYNLVALSTFTLLYSHHHHLSPECFHLFKPKLCTHETISPKYPHNHTPSLPRPW